MKKLACLFPLCFCFSCMGQDSSSTEKKLKFTVSGYIDIYYQYDFNNPADKLRPPFIYNFKKHNQVNVNLALIEASIDSKKFRSSIGIMAGNYATYNLAAEPEFFRYIYEASVGYQFSDKFSVDGGIFPSHIGNESAIAKDNFTLSRSLIAEGSPYYETGIRFNYNPNDKWMISILGLNGWQHIKDNNSSKAIATQIQFNPNEKLLFNSSTFMGNERPDTTKQFRFFHNFYATYQISSKLNLAFAFDIGAERRLEENGYDSWMGSSLLTQYFLSKKISVAGRIEFYKDKNGIIVSNYLPTEFKTTGCSLNIDYHPLTNMVIRTEIRSLKSPNNIYTRNSSSVKSDFSLLTSLAFYF